MASELMKKVCTHLEFMGYNIQIDEKVTKAKHDSRLNILLRDFNGGILLTAFFSGNDFAKRDRAGYLEFINGMNQKAAVTRVYADRDNDLAFEGWYPGMYDKAAFGTFIDLWDHDTGVQLREKAAEARKYLA